MSNSQTMDLTHGSVPKLLGRFAWPFLLANLMQSLYNVVDMIVVGQFVGSAGLSAVNTSGIVTQLFFSIGSGLAMGSQVMIAQYKGANDHKSLTETIGTVLSSMVILSIVLAAVVIVFAKPVLRLVNMPAESFDQGYAYLVICAVGCLFIFGYNSICSILRGMGDSRSPMIFVAVATVVNIVLDLLFVAVIPWGAGGAALATVIAQGVAFIFSLVYLYKRRESFAFDFKRKSFRIVGSRVKTILKLGIPFVIQFSFINVSVMFVVSLVNSYGVIASAAYGVGTRVDNFALLPANALSSAGATMVGQNIGAGKRERAGKTVWWTLGMGLAIELVLMALIQLFPGAIIRVFDSDPEVIKIGTTYLRYLTISYVAHAGMAGFFSMTNGSGFSSLTMIACLFDGLFLRISLAYLFSVVLELGLPGIFLGATIAPFGAALVGGIYFFSGKWKSRAALTESNG